MMKRLAKATASAALVLLSLSACASGPKSATEVLDKAIENDIKSYSMSLTSDFSITPKNDEFFGKLSMSVSSNTDVSDDTTHGSVGTVIKTESESITEPSVMEFYTVTDKNGSTTYSKGLPIDVSGLFGLPTQEEENWTKQVVEEVSEQTTSLSNLKPLFKNAEFKNMDGNYYIGIDIDDIIEQLKSDKDIKIEDKDIAMLEKIRDLPEMKDFIITLTFNHDCYLKAIDMTPVNIKMSSLALGEASPDDFVMALLGEIDSVSFDFDIDITKHNKLDKIVIPQTIVESAKTSEELLQEMTNLDGLSDVTAIPITEDMVQDLGSQNTMTDPSASMSMNDLQSIIDNEGTTTPAE